MSDFWFQLTLPQANLLAAFFTMVAAIFAFVVGGLLFGNKVRSLQDAMKTAEQDLEKHISKLQTAISGVKSVILEKVAEIEAITLATGERVASESGRDAVASGLEEIDEGAGVNHVNEPKARLLAAWEDIRKKLESAASNDKIDGRTRAKYLRIDRRSYRELISALLRDGHLVHVVEQLNRAVELRNQTKRGRLEVTEALAAEMESLRNKIVL